MTHTVIWHYYSSSAQMVWTIKCSLLLKWSKKTVHQWQLRIPASLVQHCISDLQRLQKWLTNCTSSAAGVSKNDCAKDVSGSQSNTRWLCESCIWATYAFAIRLICSNYTMRENIGRKNKLQLEKSGLIWAEQVQLTIYYKFPYNYFLVKVREIRGKKFLAFAIMRVNSYRKQH